MPLITPEEVIRQVGDHLDQMVGLLDTSVTMLQGIDPNVTHANVVATFIELVEGNPDERRRRVAQKRAKLDVQLAA